MIQNEFRYIKTTLQSGLKVSVLEIPARKSVAVGLLFKVGSRRDPENRKGMTHLIEHMLFKGTARFDASSISREIEKLGGNIDGYTTHEELNIWSFLPEEYIEKPLEIFSEMLYSSLFDPAELEKEKQVIIEEMGEIDDNPSQKIGEIYPFLLWGKNPLAYPILGKKNDVKSINRGELFDFFRANFGFSNSVLIVAGGTKAEKIVSCAEKWFPKNISNPSFCKLEPPVRQNKGSFYLVERNGNQAHLIIGTDIFPYTDKRRYPFVVLDVILGRGASSRLFLRLREETGLVYTVYPFVEYFTDVGFYGIYLSCDIELLNDVIHILYNELVNLPYSITPLEFQDAKSSIRGRTIIEFESVLANFNRLADIETLVGDYIPIETELESIEQVDLNSVRELAFEYLRPQNLTGLILGRRPKVWDENLWGELNLLEEEKFES